jgi:hypothetical protein
MGYGLKTLELMTVGENIYAGFGNLTFHLQRCNVDLLENLDLRLLEHESLMTNVVKFTIISDKLTKSEPVVVYY